MYKYELAARLGVSPGTLRRWLNERYYKDLVKLGYSKRQCYLTPGQVAWLAAKLDFDPLCATSF